MLENKASDVLAQNPRMIGVVFMVLLLLSQVGTVAAGSASSINGP